MEAINVPGINFKLHCLQSMCLWTHIFSRIHWVRIENRCVQQTFPFERSEFFSKVRQPHPLLQFGRSANQLRPNERRREIDKQQCAFNKSLRELRTSNNHPFRSLFLLFAKTRFTFFIASINYCCKKRSSSRNTCTCCRWWKAKKPLNGNTRNSARNYHRKSRNYVPRYARLQFPVCVCVFLFFTQSASRDRSHQSFAFFLSLVLVLLYK